MRKQRKGFTLVELMIAVAIIGILAALAVPSYLRYQLRSKFAELKTNVEAIGKSEETLRQAERVLCNSAMTGYYVATQQIPAGAPAANRISWQNTDNLAASAIDWLVQGSTYGVYRAFTANAPVAPAGQVNACAAPLGNLGGSIAISAHSDLDGDGVLSTVALWTPMFNNSTGAAVAGAATITAMAGADVSGCAGGAMPTSVGPTQATSCSRDNIF